MIALFAVLYAMADVYSDMLNAGIKAYNSGNYKKALTFFNKANEQAPKGRAASWVSKCKKAIKDQNSQNAGRTQAQKEQEELRRQNEELRRQNEALRRQQEQQAEAERKRKQEEEARRQQEQAFQPLSNRTFTANGVSFTMVGVQGGTFQMGSTDGGDDEKPVHSVTLSSYYIGQTEVTQALWKAVMGSNPSYFKGDNLPVEMVSWHDCQTFIQKINQLTGETFRLPTEAEWEFAAKGGRQSKGYTYSGSNTVGDVAWFIGNSSDRTHPVATKSPNELGIYDMSGNVYEWCQDWYGDYSSSAQTNPAGPTSGSYRVCRGRSWCTTEDCRTAYRVYYAPSGTWYNLGLRLALSDLNRTIELQEGVTAEIGGALSQSTEVTLTCNNPNATIFIDGVNQGTIKSLYNLGYGEHSIRLTAPEYNDLQTTINVQPNTANSFHLNHEAKFGNKSFTVKGVTFYMIPVEGGTFQMGKSADGNDEKPVHSVTLSSYYIGQTEVTQALWKAVMGRNPSCFKGGNLPVERVSWKDCQKFIKKLNKLTGETFRLPTEAEWEYAAKGGNKSKGYIYSGSNTIDDVAWYTVNAYDKGRSSPDYGTHPVATKSPNELGIYDMTGNVWEWCQDRKGFYSSSAQTNPTGPTSGSNRVNRGGDWSDLAAFCRTAYRSSNTPTYTSYFLGLRLAR